MDTLIYKVRLRERKRNNIINIKKTKENDRKDVVSTEIPFLNSDDFKGGRNIDKEEAWKEGQTFSTI